MKYLIFAISTLGFTTYVSAQEVQVWECVVEGNQNISMTGDRLELVNAANLVQKSSLIFKIWPINSEKAEIEGLLVLQDNRGWDIRIFRNPNRPSNIFLNKKMPFSAAQSAVTLKGSIPKSEYTMTTSLDLKAGTGFATVSHGWMEWMEKSSLTATFEGCKRINL